MREAGLTIGIDARAAAEEPAGRGRFVRELLLALAARDDPHRYRLFVRSRWEARLDERFAQTEIALPDPLWHAAAARRAGSCDVFLSTNSYLTAWLMRAPCAVVVYDLIAFRPDARPQRRAALIERATIRPAVRRSARLICISHATERDLVDRFPRAGGKTAVVPLAADRRFDAERAREHAAAVARRHRADAGSFVLATGTLEPRKNLPRLIRAHASLPADLRRLHPLVIVGPRGWEVEEILRAAGDSEDARLTGFVPDDELVALYAGCAVFCYPSLYEGFGLPVLEAMRAGAPVVTSNVSSMPEIADSAAHCVDPRDEEALRNALERLLRSPEERAELAARGRRRAQDFSWERTAAEMLVELERVARR